MLLQLSIQVESAQYKLQEFQFSIEYPVFVAFLSSFNILMTT